MVKLDFSGGWSYTQKEITELFRFIDLVSITKNNSYSILEFGSGVSSIKLAEIFNNIDNFTYYTYESDPLYVQKHEKINTVLYDEKNITNVNLDDNLKNLFFDLILVDGPTGDNRKLWYNKFKKYVKPGTIILVDDFNHYASFGHELDTNFDYELLSFNNEPFVPNGEHSWKIVRVINTK